MNDFIKLVKGIKIDNISIKDVEYVNIDFDTNNEHLEREYLKITIETKKTINKNSIEQFIRGAAYTYKVLSNNSDFNECFIIHIVNSSENIEDNYDYNVDNIVF